MTQQILYAPKTERYLNMIAKFSGNWIWLSRSLWVVCYGVICVAGEMSLVRDKQETAWFY